MPLIWKNIFLFSVCLTWNQDSWNASLFYKVAPASKFWGLNKTVHLVPSDSSESRVGGFTTVQSRSVFLLLTNCILLYKRNKMRAQHYESTTCNINIMSIMGLRQDPLKSVEDIPSTSIGFMLESTSAIYRVKSGPDWRIMLKPSLTSRKIGLFLMQLTGKQNTLVACYLSTEEQVEWMIPLIHYLPCVMFYIKAHRSVENKKTRRISE